MPEFCYVPSGLRLHEIFPKTLQRTRRAERCATADNLILTRRAMRKHLLRTTAALTLALLGGVGFAAAVRFDGPPLKMPKAV
jgi:hypothetical protein